MFATNLTGGTPHACSIKLTKKLTLWPSADEVDLGLAWEDPKVRKALDRYARRGWVELFEKQAQPSITPLAEFPRKQAPKKKAPKKKKKKAPKVETDG
jgi:hypothetical protein